MSLVTISVMGSLTREPELFNRPTGLKTVLSIAVKSAGGRNAEGKYDPEFYRIELWGKLAEIAGKYLNKGSHIGVSGRLYLDKWQDQNGKSRITPVVKADQISLPPPLRVVQAQEALSHEAHASASPREQHSVAGVGSEDPFGDFEGSEVNENELVGVLMTDAIPPPTSHNLATAGA